MKQKIILAAIILVGGVYFLFRINTPERSVSSPSPSTSSIAQSGQPTTSATPRPQAILLKVPFASQAPTGNWSDPREQNGCEETSSLMAMAWVNGDPSIINPEQKILAIADFEQNTYGNYIDTDAQDTVKRIFNAYFHYSNVRAQDNPTANDIIAELSKGNLVLTPMNGQKLNNPYYTPPGPLEHMVVVIGYDPARNEFITNDPGTRRGQGMRYSVSLFMNAITNYPTGQHEPIIGSPKAMIVVSK